LCEKVFIMANIEGKSPTVSLIKENKVEYQGQRDAVVSQDGVIFDRRNSGRAEVLVARGGVYNSRPTFKMPEGSAYRMPPEGID
jgi:hypothetical protein